MKVVKFSDTCLPIINGASYSIDLWKRKLEERGIDVTLICPMNTSDLNVKSIPFPLYEGYQVGIPRRISNKIDEPDLIHIHTPFTLGSLGAHLSRKKGIPRIFTHHTDPEDYIDYLSKNKYLTSPLLDIYDLWEKKLLDNSDTVTVPTKKIKKEMLKAGIKNTKVISNGLNQDFFQPSEKIYKEKNTITLGYSGRHGKEKKLEDLIKVADRFKTANILIAGDGPAKPYYEKMAENKDNIKFLGFLDRQNLPNFYSSLDVFVFPSTVETQGLVGLEANSCGTPVVGANKKALKTTIREGYSGYLYEPGNIDDLESKINTALKNLTKLEKRSKKYAGKHSAKKTIDKIINLYERVISS